MNVCTYSYRARVTQLLFPSCDNNEHKLLLPSTSTSFPTVGRGSRLCSFFFDGLDIVIRSLSFSFISLFLMPEEEWCPMLPEDGRAGKGNPSIDSPPSLLSLGERMSFIFRPSPSRSVSGSPLPAPPWNKDDFEEDEEDAECFLDNDGELGWRECEKEWEKEWPLLELPSRLRSLDEECEA